MTPETRTLPIVLAVGGHDPGGGAGIQADIEAISANGCQAATAVTCLTVQDSCGMDSLNPVPASLLLAQAQAVLADYPIAAIKIGLLGNASLAEALAELLQQQPLIPVILDPVLATGRGDNLASDELLAVMRERLLPLSTLITPNSLEARSLSGMDNDLDACAHHLLQLGADNILITGTHEQAGQVVNRLYNAAGLQDATTWKRLPGEYHGSGCTLAAAIAAQLAGQVPLPSAVSRAQEYTWQSLAQGLDCGHCQSLPDRLFSLRRRDRT